MSFEMENLFDKLIQSGSIGSDGIADNQHTDKTASVLGKTPPKKEEEDSVAPSPVVSRRGSSIDSDLATDDIDGLKKFTIPKQNKKGLLEVVDLGSREYLQDLYPLIQRSFRDPAAEKNFKFTKAWLVHNKLLQKVFYEKRKELTGREVQTSYAFLCSTSQSEVNRICSQGVNIGNCSTSCLGNPEMGVSLCRHADIVRQVPMQFGFSAKLIIFKIMKGKTMRMLESSAHLDPTPNCDCHVSKTANSFNLSAVTMLQAFQSTQIYLYEYGDLGIEQRPRQVLPHAVVEFTYIPDSTSQSSTKSSNVAAKSSVAKSAKKPTSKRFVFLADHSRVGDTNKQQGGGPISPMTNHPKRSLKQGPLSRKVGQLPSVSEGVASTPSQNNPPVRSRSGSQSKMASSNVTTRYVNDCNLSGSSSNSVQPLWGKRISKTPDKPAFAAGSQTKKPKPTLNGPKSPVLPRRLPSTVPKSPQHVLPSVGAAKSQNPSQGSWFPVSADKSTTKSKDVAVPSVSSGSQSSPVVSADKISAHPCLRSPARRTSDEPTKETASEIQVLQARTTLHDGESVKPSGTKNLDVLTEVKANSKALDTDMGTQRELLLPVRTQNDMSVNEGTTQIKTILDKPAELPKTPVQMLSPKSPTPQRQTTTDFSISTSQTATYINPAPDVSSSTVTASECSVLQSITVPSLKQTRPHVKQEAPRSINTVYDLERVFSQLKTVAQKPPVLPNTTKRSMQENRTELYQNLMNYLGIGGTSKTLHFGTSRMGSMTQLNSGKKIAASSQLDSAGQIGSNSQLGSSGQLDLIRQVGSGGQLGSTRQIGSASQLGSTRQIGSGSQLPSSGQLVSGSQLGFAGQLGSGSQLGSAGQLGSGIQLGSAGQLGSGSQLGSAGQLGSGSQLGSAGQLGSGSQLGSAEQLGSNTQLGRSNKLGPTYQADMLGLTNQMAQVKEAEMQIRPEGPVRQNSDSDTNSSCLEVEVEYQQKLERGVKGTVGFTSHRPPLLSTPPGSQPIGGAPQERKEEQYGEMTFSSHGQCLPPQAGQNVHSHFSEKGAPQTQPPFTKLMAPQVQSQVTEQMAPAFQPPLTQQVAPQVQKQFTQKVAPLLQSQLSHQAEPHANVAQKERTDIQTQFFEQVQTQLSQRRTSDSDHQALISQTKKLLVDTDPHGVTQPETRPVSGPVLGTMDMGQQVSEDPKPRGVLIWRGEVSNRGGFLCGVEMISYGLCVKPARIGNTMNISTQMSVKKVTQRYLTGLVMDRHHEVINNGFFYNYCELRPQGGCQNKFNSLLAVLLRKDAAIIVKIEEADALLFPNCEATHRLGLSTPSEQRMALHCVFISEKSRVEAMRDKVVRSPPAHRSNLRHAQRSLTMSLGGSGRYKTGQTQSGTCTNRQSHDYTPPVAAEEDRPSQAVRVDFSRAFGGSYDTTGLRQDASGSTWNHPFAPGFPSQPPGVSPVQGLRDASGDQFRLPPKLTRTPHVPLDHFDTGFNSQVVSGALLMDTKLEKGFQDQGIMQNNRNLAIARGTYQFKEPIPKSLITFPSTIGGTTGQSQLMTSVQQVQAPSIVQAQQKDMSVSFQSSVGNTSYTSPSPSTSSSYIKSDTVQSSLSLASQNNISSISMPSIASPQTLDGLAPPGGSNLLTSPRLIPSSPGVGVNPPLGISSRPGPSPKEGELTHKSISVLINQLTENIEQLQAQQKLLIEQRKMTPPQTPPRTPTGEQDLSPASLYKRSRDPRMAKGMFRSPDGATVEMRSPPVAYISNSGGRDQQTQPMDITMVKSDSDFAETVPHSSDAKSSIVVSQTGAGALRTATSSQHSDLVKSPSVGNPASTSTCKTAIANTNKTSVTITQTTLRPAVSSTLTSAGLLTSPAQTTGRSSVSTTQAMSISTGPIVSLTTPAKVDSPIMKDTMTTVSVERGLSSTTGTTMSSMSNIEMVRSTQKTHMALNMASNTEGLTSTTMKTGLDNEKSKGHKDLSKGGNNTNLSQKIDYTKRQNYPVESPTKESIRDIQLPPGSPKYPSPRIFPPGGATQGMGKTLNSGISLEKKVFPSISSRDPRVVSQVTAQTAGSVPQTIQSLTKDRHLSGEEKISDTRNVSSLSDVEADKIVKRIPRTVSQDSRNATEIDMKKQYPSADTQSTVTTDKQKEVQSQQTHLSNLNTRNNLSDSTSRSKAPTSEQQKLSSKVTPVAISPGIGSNSQTSQSKRDADYIESADDMRALLDSTITVATTDMAASPSPVKTVDPPFKKKELLVKNSEPGDKKEEVSVKIGGKPQVKSISASSKQAELLREKAEKSLEKGGMLAKTVPPSATSLSATTSSTGTVTGSQKSGIKSMDTKQNIMKNFRIPKISEGCAPTTIPFEIPRLAESIPVPSAVETEGVEKKVKETGEMRDGKPVGLQEKRCGPMLGSRPFLSEEPANKKAKPSSSGSTDTHKSLPKMVLASLTKSNRIDDSELSENEAPKEFKGLGSLGGSFKVTITKTETPTRSSGLKKNLALKKAIMFLTSIAPRYNNFTHPIQDEELAACRAGAFSNVHIKVGNDGHHDVTVTFHQDVDDQGSDQKALTSDPIEVLATTVREAIHKKSTLQLSATELYMQNLTNIAVHHLMPDEESSSPEPEQCLGDTQGNISSDVSSVVEEKREPAVLSKGKVVEHLTEGHGPFGMMSPSQDATVSSSMGTPPKTFQIQTTKMSAEMPTKLAMPQLPCSPIRSSPAGTPTKVTKVTGAPLESTPLKTGPSLCGPEIQTEGKPSTEKNNDITDLVSPKGDGRKVDQPLAKSPSVSMVSVDRQKRRHHPYLPSLPKPEVKSFIPASDLQELMQSLHSAAFKGRRQAACNADSLFLQRLAKKLVRGASPRFAGFDFLQKMCKDGSSLSRSGNDEDESQPIKPSDIPDFERRKELTRQLDAELERQPEVDNEGEYELEVSLYSKKDDQPDTVKYQGDGEKPKAPSAITLIVQPPAATAVPSGNHFSSTAAPSATKDGVSGIKSPGRSPISPRSPYIWDSSVSSPKWPPEKSLNLKPIDFEFRDIEYTPNPLVLHLAVLEIHYDAEKDPRLRCQSSKLYGRRRKLIRSISTPEKKMSSPAMRQVRTLSAEQNQADVKNTEASSLLGTPLYRSKSESKNTESSSVGVPHHSSQSVLKKKTSPLKTEASFQEHGDSKHNADLLAAAKAELHLVDQQIEELKKKLKFKSKSQQGDGDSGMESSTLNKTEKVEGAAQLQTPEVATVKLEKDQTPVHPESFKIDSSSPGMPEGKLSKQVIKRNLPKRFSTVEKVSWWLEGGSDVSAEEIAQYADSELDGAMDDASSRTEPAEDDENQGAALDDMLSRNTVAVSSRTESMIEAGMGGNLTASTVCMEITSQDKDGNQHLRHSASSSAADVEVLSSLVPLPPTLPQRRKLAEMAPMLARKTGENKRELSQ
ncbi:uncharacterized protein LOC106172556 isoform X2 [Lingula anatina]|uniref:Uncharacterized protein LOC106172556 isoform X2 n=1 Tax=Lingula anatina TaxID=7574 RepID=A0A1S3JF52_LINAN|nr:uncharacterized protein LOC106172556 isoform X2 [Lingula anatina]|eukprot:XP_013408776.1 uncharacterized protein LOC106172556 isoform X2 [Lingula anatina]